MICLTLTDSNISKNKAIIESYFFFELRLDLMKIRLEDCLELISIPNKIFIVSFRLGEFDFDNQYINAIISRKPDVIDFDIDFYKQNPLIDFESIQSEIILSYHNYNQTPDSIELNSIIAELKQYNPDKIKIACKSNSDNDLERVTELYADYNFIGEVNKFFNCLDRHFKKNEDVSNSKNYSELIDLTLRRLNSKKNGLIALSIGKESISSRIKCLEKSAPFIYAKPNSLDSNFDIPTLNEYREAYIKLSSTSE